MVDVARSAGVAVSTVSRVVNRDPTVGTGLAERVHGAISALGWEADDRARHLRLGVSGTIGAAVNGLDSPFLREAERAARALGLMVLATSTEDDEQLENEAIRSLIRRRVDGLVVEQRRARTDPYLGEQIARGLAVVAIDQPLPGVSADSVVCDNAGGITLAHAHLTRHGHRHIAFLGDDERVFTGRARADAFRRCAAAAGRARPPVHTGDPSLEHVGAALDRLLTRRPRPTALITGNAAITVATFQHLGMGLAGLALVGFDDVELAGILEPPRTVVAQDHAAMGRAALQLLVSRIGDPSLPVRQTVVPVTLVDRSDVRPRSVTALTAVPAVTAAVSG